MLKNQLCVTGINYILKYIQIEKLVYIVIIFLNITVFTIIFSNLISQVTKQAVFSCLSRNVWERWRRKKDWRKYMMLSSNFLLLTTGNPNTHYTWITSSTICHWKCDRESSDIFGVSLSTLEYLIKHLAHLATCRGETNMHIKNLAIVWAPNLLR